MDYLKTRAPFWKQVEKPTGEAWVDAKAADDSAAERWLAAPKPRGGKVSQAVKRQSKPSREAAK